ncbi:hypothetical protein [Micromonospora deserti]|uniref:hypothetical protein n=1 Tax=Micromonospora deserti TaxID=2070366 RepID=UPI001F38EECF|nr:hypothetical protein [Micromonospora deserti]
MPCDQPVGLEVAQPLGEHLLADPRYPAAQFAVPVHAFLEVGEDHRLPLSADDVDGQLDRAVVSLWHVSSCSSARTGWCVLDQFEFW